MLKRDRGVSVGVVFSGREVKASNFELLIERAIERGMKPKNFYYLLAHF